MTHEKLLQNNCNINEVKTAIKENKLPNVHKGRMNMLTYLEIAVVKSGEHFTNRDITIEGKKKVFNKIDVFNIGILIHINSTPKHVYCFITGRDSRLKHNETHPSYNLLQYPLLFPFGSDGYSIHMKQINRFTELPAMQYYRYLLMVKEGNYILLYRDLLV